MAEPLTVVHDKERDELIVEGVRYSGDLFRGFGWRIKPGHCVRLERRENDQVLLSECNCKFQPPDEMPGTVDERLARLGNG